MGKIIPVALTEALPGDTFQQSTSLLMRLSPQLAPVMHPVSIRLHHWFVPHRLNWEGWEDFITGGPDGTGTAEPYPTNAAPVTVTTGDLWDYFGLPVGKTFPAGSLSTLPLQAYNHIFNEFYRDQDLVSEVTLENPNPLLCAWQKDYFTSARPWSQKGPSVTLPIGGSAPVVSTGENPNFNAAGDASFINRNIQVNTGANNPVIMSGASVSALLPMQFGNMTGLEADLSAAEAANIIDVRRAFALQRYQEARAQYGSRYTEYLRYLGVNPQDSRLQRPEFLGGGKQTISFSEVLKTGSGEDPSEPIGTMKGHGIAALRSNRYRYFCQEHGYILTLMSVRPKTLYMDGMPKTFSKRTKEEYYQKELELIGQQEVYKREIYADGSATDAEVFGYNDRYSEYRYGYSGVRAEFRDILDYWHLGRKFASAPTLNGSFVECDPTKRIFAEQTQHSLWCMLNHNIKARRLVGHATIGRII